MVRTKEGVKKSKQTGEHILKIKKTISKSPNTTGKKTSPSSSSTTKRSPSISPKSPKKASPHTTKKSPKKPTPKRVKRYLKGALSSPSKKPKLLDGADLTEPSEESSTPSVASPINLGNAVDEAQIKAEEKQSPKKRYYS